MGRLFDSQIGYTVAFSIPSTLLDKYGIPDLHMFSTVRSSDIYDILQHGPWLVGIYSTTVTYLVHYKLFMLPQYSVPDATGMPNGSKSIQERPKTSVA